MIPVSNTYKEKIKELGRQIDAKINYYKSRGLNTEDDREILTENDLNFTIEQTNFDEISETIGSEDIYQLNIIHKGDMLKSYMSEIDFEVKQNLSVGDGIEAEFGLKVDDERESVTINGKSTQNGTPTPSNPISIESLTGNTSVEIDNEIYQLNLGSIELRSINIENLFNKDVVVTGKRLDGANGNYYNDDGYFTSDFIKVVPGEVYIKNSPTTDAYHRICFYSSNDYTTFISASNNNSITVPTTANYIRFCGKETELNTTQFEKGNAMHNYTPFGVPLPIVKDSIYNSSEDWFIKREVGKTVLNGTESGVRREASNTSKWRFCLDYSGVQKVSSGSQLPYIISDKFITGTLTAQYNMANCISTGVSTNTYYRDITIYNDDISSYTYAQFQTWLSNNNIEVYYQLATPTIEQITDENLIKQLNAIKEGYEFINYGKHIIYSKQYNEDTSTYSYKAYDKMLYAMKPFDLEVQYPISVKNFLSAIGDKIGCPIDDVEPINGSQEILSNPYYELNVTYRDVLDDLSAIVGGPICINNGHISVAYIQNTNETIDEEYLKETGVSFGEKYGPINTITFTRSEIEDAIQRRDEESISNNGICEIKLEDNPFLQFENWEDYIDNLFNHLNGLEYYINDVSSVGITYLSFMDKYSITRGETSYTCLMLNDEIKINQGLEENIYTEKPKQDVPTYTSNTKTNKDVSFTIDRQGRQIISKVGKDEVISTINQTPEEIKINANKIALEGYTTINNGFSVDLEGNMSCNNATINGKISNEGTTIYPNGQVYIMSTQSSPNMWITTQENRTTMYGGFFNTGISYHDKMSNDNLNSSIRLAVNGGTNSTTGEVSPLIMVYKVNKATNDWKYLSQLTDHSLYITDYNDNGTTNSTSHISAFEVVSPRITQTSLEKDKKNIKKYKNALEEVLKTDIYEYNLKSEEDKEKKHIGFVIGNKYNYSKKITSVNDKGEEIGVDTYSMTSLCLQAIKEQQQQIEELKKEISKLKGGI